METQACLSQDLWPILKKMCGDKPVIKFSLHVEVDSIVKVNMEFLGDLNETQEALETISKRYKLVELTDDEKSERE